MNNRNLFLGEARRDESSPAASRVGFTLIELLVVIAIIALLISILLPAMSMARHEGAKAKCLANIRSIAQATVLYMDNQEDSKLIPWYQLPTHGGYNPNIISPWVFGGFKAPNPSPGTQNWDSSLYTAEIRPLNKFAAPAAEGDVVVDLYKCPSDRSFRTSIIGTPNSGVYEEERSSWEANGSSYTLNTRFMQGYVGGDGNFSPLTPQSVHDFATRIAGHLTGGEAARFIMWAEQGFYSATYRATLHLPNGAGPQRPGWHRKFSTWSLGFADGHAVNTYYDTRLANGDAGTIWQPNFHP
ncbi:MAG: type II secretion system protein [Phycisphaerae bacterium]